MVSDVYLVLYEAQVDYYNLVTFYSHDDASNVIAGDEVCIFTNEVINVGFDHNVVIKVYENIEH